MRPELEKYYKIDQFLDGKLSGKDLEEFLENMKDPAFADEVEVQKQVNRVVEGAVFDQLRDQISNDIKNFDQKKAFRNKIIKGVSFLILAVLITSLYLYSSKDSKELAKISERKNPIVAREDVKSVDVPAIIESKEPIISVTPKAGTPKKSVKSNDPVQLAGPTQRDNTMDSVVAKTESFMSNPGIVKHPELDTQPIPLPSASAGCTGLIFGNAPLVEGTCQGKSIGKVSFEPIQITGGKPPYKITTTKGIKDHHKNEYSHLPAGEVLFEITDMKGCKGEMVVTVPEENCMETKHTLNTGIGEVWQIPFKSEPYKLMIYNQGGMPVFSKSSEELSSNQWSGTDDHGTFLHPGLYIYVIEYRDGKKDSGQLSLVK